MRIERYFADIGTTKLFIRDSGSRNPPILCLHGLWGRGETWIDFIRHYADRHRILAPDLRGHGLSDKPNAYYTIEEMAEDAHRLIVKLGLNDAIILGHSMGGGVAAALAALFPEGVKAIGILDKTASGPEKEGRLLSFDIGDRDPETGKWTL